MRRAARTDKNLMPIVEAARDLGYLVHVANSELCDAIVQFRHVTELWEIKTEKGTFTDLQKKRRAEGWRIRTIRSVDDVIKARKEIL